MISKQDPPQSGKLVAINKQILEIKKKIQLSEGQRKALFEECETERKNNATEILRMKKEISELLVRLKETRSLSAKNRIQCTRLEDVIGHIGDKTCAEVGESLDLQIIDKTKHLDILKYEVRKQEDCLKKLADEYQTLLSGRLEKYTKKIIDTPIKKTKRELQNNIHAVQVQWREAEHVRIRYKEIKKALQEDASRFESNIIRTKQQLQVQQNDIERLQRINTEAGRMRAIARNILLQEEKGALKSAHSRERQATEGKHLIVERKLELEKLEKKIFQTGKTPVRPETDGDDSNLHTPTPPINAMEAFSSDFETLKDATGGTTIDEVLARFLAQKETSSRLNSLRKSGEEDKHKLEGKHDHLNAQLESLKFAEVKDAEESAEELELLQKQIEQQRKKIDSYRQSQNRSDEILRDVFENIQGIFISVDPDKEAKNDPVELVMDLCAELKMILDRIRELEEEETEKRDEVEISPEKWLPQSYSNLMRRTPLPQQGAASPAPPPGSDEEEEVPSRGYMKRQAQIVVDAKSRRKSMRFPIKK